MENNTNYETWSLEALQKEKKKLKQQQLFSATFIGFLLGVIVYSLVTNGFKWLPLFLSVGLIYLVYRNAINIKQQIERVQTEIINKSA
jgi:hypothetical protein